jgi:uncharacterized protein
MSEIRIHKSLREIDATAWNLCQNNDAENYHYMRAVEDAQLEGFTLFYITVWQDESLLACAPAFLTEYALDTTLQGIGKRITRSISSMFPSLLRLTLACIGSACSEQVMLGFHPRVIAQERSLLLREMLQAFERYALDQNAILLGIKDIPLSNISEWESCLAAQGFASVGGMPTAKLKIDFTDIESYLSRLSKATRKDMRRKLKHRDAVEVQMVHSLDGVMDEVMALYRSTRARSDWQFEELNSQYFRSVLQHMPQHAFAVLYRVNQQLLAVNLLVHNECALIDKFFCMSEEGRAYHLYFLSWFTNIDWCLAHNRHIYQSGQANNSDKKRLGSTLYPNAMYFKHRNRIAQRVLKLASPLLTADDSAQKEAA